MKIGSHALKLEKRLTLTGWQAVMSSILAIFIALALFSIIFLIAGINPLFAYQEIFSYAFANPFGSPLTINRLIVLFGSSVGYMNGRFNVNEIVVTMMLYFITFWLVSFLIKEGGPFMRSGGEGDGFELPSSIFGPLIKGIPFTIFIALGFAGLLYFMVS